MPTTGTGEALKLRVHGEPHLPTLIYLPGIHGDWTLVGSFREALAGRVRFVEFTYPRLEWPLEKYANAIERALAGAEITSGWLLAESFGSLPAWQIIARAQSNRSGFQATGIILAGGFIKHPWPWGAKFLRWVTRCKPRWLLQAVLYGLERFARWRHRNAPTTLKDVAEFVQNRLHPDDMPTWCHRYTLVAETDLRPTAQRFAGPVFQLTGLVDPIVPALLVRRWLRMNCPSYRATHIVGSADHNVLGTAPQQSAELVLNWMGAGSSSVTPKHLQPAKQ